MTDRGYIKRLPHDTYKRQNRGGRGIIGMVTREMDAVQHMITCNTLDSLLFLTNKGKVYQLKAHEVPDAGRQAKGSAPGQPGVARARRAGHRPDRGARLQDDGEYLVLATKQGKIKKTAAQRLQHCALDRHHRPQPGTGRRAGGLAPVPRQRRYHRRHRKGQAIRFSEKDVRPMGRATAGVAPSGSRKGDEVMGMDVIHADSQRLPADCHQQGHGQAHPPQGVPPPGPRGRRRTAITVIRQGRPDLCGPRGQPRRRPGGHLDQRSGNPNVRRRNTHTRGDPRRAWPS